MEYTEQLKTFFERHANPVIAEPMAKYMRNKFLYLGLKTPERKLLNKQFFKEHGYPDKKDFEKIILDLWELPQREYQYIALDILEKFIKKLEKNDIALLEKLIIQKSWWDTVDYLATRIIGEYFKKYPENIILYTSRWIDSENIWLQRTAILFQLKYKKETDKELLFRYINKCSDTKEFFINKAIGWALREYVRTDKAWVVDFVQNSRLSNLSIREALKHVRV